MCSSSCRTCCCSSSFLLFFLLLVLFLMLFLMLFFLVLYGRGMPRPYFMSVPIQPDLNERGSICRLGEQGIGTVHLLSLVRG
ncbi:secreted protein [gut metagenome]|uniref:Secreted protein n=1 Tax=gut metagenome TaxID=749906 RepID=J9F5H6_9ZZZZ